MKRAEVDAPFLLVTIPQSHFCEKARWALERLGLPFTEEGHAPILHAPAVRRRGGRRTTPVLVSRAGVFADSTQILQYLDGFASNEQRLYPLEEAARREVEELEDLYDKRLGPATRLWAYDALLPLKDEVMSLLQPRVPRWEYMLGRATYPLFVLAMRRFLGITPARTVRALEVTREIFDGVAERLRDGRRYLTGERFTAADLAFAALAAVVLLPPEYGGPLPALAVWPEAARREIESLQRHLAGAFVLRLYREQRRS